MNTQTAKMTGKTAGLLLSGLDGSNTLAFLSALGLLRVLDEAAAGADVCMHWTVSGTAWVPVLSGGGAPATEAALLDTLERLLVRDINAHPARLLAALSEAKEDLDRRRALLSDPVAGGPKQLPMLALLAALASDAVPAAATNQLQTARRDYFYGNLTSVVQNCAPDHLRRTIFAPWDYADAIDNQSLHLDPSEDRRHAHQWSQPSGDPERKRSGGMLGANRLAIEALALFTSVPQGDALQTAGFTGTRARNTRWTWPIWSTPLSLAVVRSLLTLPDLQAETLDVPTRQNLNARGVDAVFRTRRILVGKTPNFTPAQCIA
jgi:CRISPR-associated endonuclease/helicase Cas3